jgi:hypothetical protein
MRTYAVLTVCLLFFAASPARAEFYRWVDRDGKEFFTNDREKVPAEYRDRSAPVETDGSRVSVGERPVAAGKTARVSAEHRDKHGKGEEYWRRRAESLRRELHDLEAEYDVVLKRERDQDERQKTVIGKRKKSASSVEKKMAQLEKKIAVAKRRLEVDLPEEARKADAYPGWIRE